MIKCMVPGCINVAQKTPVVLIPLAVKKGDGSMRHMAIPMALLCDPVCYGHSLTLTIKDLIATAGPDAEQRLIDQCHRRGLRASLVRAKLQYHYLGWKPAQKTRVTKDDLMPEKEQH